MPPSVALSSISIVTELSSCATLRTLCPGHVDVVGEQEFERRLGDEIFVLRVELVVDDGDAAAVGHDLEARRRSIFEQHMARALEDQLPLGPLAVRSDLNKIGGHDAGRIKPGVGALHRFGGGRSAPGRRSSAVWRTFAPPLLAGARAAASCAKAPRPRAAAGRGRARAIGTVSPAVSPFDSRLRPPNRRSPDGTRKYRMGGRGAFPQALRSFCGAARGLAGLSPSTRAASSAAPRRSTIASTCTGSTMKGGARRTWSPSRRRSCRPSDRP